MEVGKFALRLLRTLRTLESLESLELRQKNKNMEMGSSRGFID
jgi:hypothetical protein